MTRSRFGFKTPPHGRSQAARSTCRAPRCGSCRWPRLFPRCLPAVAPVARAQTPEPSDTLEEVTVTAQKVTENLQNVPVSIETLGTREASAAEHRRTSTTTSQYLAGRHDHQEHRAGRKRRRHDARLHARHQLRPGRQPFRLAADRRHIFRRAAGDHHRRHGGHAYLRHRAHRGAGGPAGHAVRRELGGGHHPHHLQQARSHQIRGELRCERRSDHATAAAPGGRRRASSTFRSSPIAAVRIVGWDEHDPGYISNVAGTNANAGIVNGTAAFRRGPGHRRSP